jgi:hypothetical protein
MAVQTLHVIYNRYFCHFHGIRCQLSTLIANRALKNAKPSDATLSMDAHVTRTQVDITHIVGPGEEEQGQEVVNRGCFVECVVSRCGHIIDSMARGVPGYTR